MAFELSAILCRSSDNTTAEKVVTFSSPPETVRDLKIAVENQHNVPQCLQTIEIGDRCIKTDDDRLSDHYVTAGDSFKVTYLHESEVDFVKTLTEYATQMKEQLMKEKQIASREGVRSIPHEPHNTLSIMLTLTSFRLFLPWLSDQTTANRKCFVQVGALDAVLSLLSYLQENDPLKKRFSQLLMLEKYLLAVLWNMAETTESQEPVISRGGIQLMLRALKSIDVSDFDLHQDLFESAAGCISNYCETRSCQLLMAPDTVALDRMLKYVLEGPTHSYNDIIISDTFYRISYSLETHRHLCNPVILGQILEVIDRRLKISDGEDDASITVYTLLMGVGRVLMLTTMTGVTVPEEHVKQIEDLIQKFLEIANVKNMRALQERHSNNWNSLIPIIEPILTPEHSCGLFNQNKVKKLFFFSLTVELPRKRLLQVARNENLLEYLTCLSWYAPTEDVKGSYVGSLSAAQLVEVPRLSTITRAKIAVVSPLGFISAQQPAHSIVRQLMNKRNMKEEQF